MKKKEKGTRNIAPLVHSVTKGLSTITVTVPLVLPRAPPVTVTVPLVLPTGQRDSSGSKEESQEEFF